MPDCLPSIALERSSSTSCASSKRHRISLEDQDRPNTSSKAKVSHIISALCPFLCPCVFQKTRRRRTISRNMRSNFRPKIACLEARLLTLYVTSLGRPSHSETWGTPTIWFVLQLTKPGTASKLQAKMIRYLVRQHQFKGQRQLKRRPHFGT